MSKIRRHRALIRSLCLALGLCTACAAEHPQPAPPNHGASFALYPADGTFDVRRGAVLVVDKAMAEVLFSDATGLHTARSGPDCALHDASSFTCKTQGLEMRLHFAVTADQRAVTVRLDVTNRSQDTLTLQRLTPLLVDAARGGALWLGKDPLQYRILENGRFGVLDQSAQLEHVGADRYALGDALVLPNGAAEPVALYRGQSVSNWNHIIANPQDMPQGLVAGWLTFAHSIPTLGIGFDPARDKPDAAGRAPFGLYAAENTLIFHGKPLAPGATFTSETLYLEPLPADPIEALEHYADAVAQAHDITPYPKRGKGHFVPSGWNSWSGGDSSGGYGQDINAQLIADNLAFYKREFANFGTDFFQVDDGWQPHDGDWQWRSDKFPAGGAAMAKSISDAGFKPGLWIAPFLVDPASQTAKDHPDWLQPREDGAIGGLGKDKQTLDLSNPAVLDHVKSLFSGLKQDGWLWAKVDFTYWALLGKHLYDPSLTTVEAWRQGWQAVRAGLGDEVFLCGIGVMGANIGTLDAMRLTIDNGPAWEEVDPDDLLTPTRGFKATMRTGARRWFYQNRIWVNHDDLLFFRSWPDPKIAPLTLTEARTFASWIGLSASIVKIGDKLLDFQGHPEWIAIVRSLLPAWPDGARPLDVMIRDYPEQFRQYVVAPAGTWDNIGLFHWGRNRDHTTTPPTDLPDSQTRTFQVACPDGCLAFDFWNQQFLGQQSGTFAVTVAPHDARVLALRKPEGHPQLLGSNRHITQGAADMGKMTWNAAKKTLTGTLVGAVGTALAPFTYQLTFFAPKGFAFQHADVDGVGAALVAQQQGEIVQLRFALPAAAQGTQVAFHLVFQ